MLLANPHIWRWRSLGGVEAAPFADVAEDEEMAFLGGVGVVEAVAVLEVVDDAGEFQAIVAEAVIVQVDGLALRVAARVADIAGAETAANTFLPFAGVFFASAAEELVVEVATIDLTVWSGVRLYLRC